MDRSVTAEQLVPPFGQMVLLRLRQHLATIALTARQSNKNAKIITKPDAKTRIYQDFKRGRELRCVG